MEDHEILIEADGSVSFIYSDILLGMMAMGRSTVRRASHVEPAGASDIFGTEWVADMAPAGGPLLGPYPTRQEALDAEVAWIKARMAERRLEVKA